MFDFDTDLTVSVEQQEHIIEEMKRRLLKPSIGNCRDCGFPIAYVQDPGRGDKRLALLPAASASSLASDEVKKRFGAPDGKGPIAMAEVPAIGTLAAGELPKYNMAKWGTHNQPSSHAKLFQGLTPPTPCTFNRNVQDENPIPEDGDGEVEASRSPESENKPDPLGPETTEYEREDLSLGLSGQEELS